MSGMGTAVAPFPLDAVAGRDSRRKAASQASVIAAAGAVACALSIAAPVLRGLPLHPLDQAIHSGVRGHAGRSGGSAGYPSATMYTQKCPSGKPRIRCAASWSPTAECPDPMPRSVAASIMFAVAWPTSCWSSSPRRGSSGRAPPRRISDAFPARYRSRMIVDRPAYRWALVCVDLRTQTNSPYGSASGCACTRTFCWSGW